eukprot:13971953-Alexandrium_andersonii.AAC.1
MVKGAAEGLGLVAIAHDIGFSASLQVCADSSAAVGIGRRVSDVSGTWPSGRSGCRSGSAPETLSC